MADVMTFPETVEEFMEEYKVVDSEHVYTNGTELVPIFRMKQWFAHLPIIEERKTGKWRAFKIGECDLIECTACKVARPREEMPTRNGGKIAWKYCPECGAKMEE